MILLLLLLSADVDAGTPRPVEVPIDSPVDVDAGVAPDFQLTAKVEPDPVAFGGAVDLVVTLTRPPKKRITLPDELEPQEALPRAGDVRREAKELPNPISGDRVQETLRFPFLALDVENLKTPAFVLKSDDGVVLEVPSLPLRVQVEPIPDLTDGGTPPGAVVMDGAAEQLTYRVRDDRPWIAIAIAALIAIVVVIARAIAKQMKKKPKQAPPPPPPRPAHEVALERLEALMPLLQKGEVTIFVEKMMDEVLRDYLAGRFALAAGTRTTREIVNDLLAVSRQDLDVTLVEDVARDADLVKFARASLAAQQAHAMAGRVRALIVATAEKTQTKKEQP